MPLDIDHEHELEAEYLSPSDTAVLEIESSEEGLQLRVAAPCPECGQTLALDASASSVSEIDLELPLEDVEESYD